MQIKSKADFEALSPRKKLFFLFYTTLMISAFTFGGGPVIVALLRQKFVEELGIFSQEEVLNFLSLAQSAPGPIAVNVSVLLSYQLLSWQGAFLSLFGTILPPLIILSLLAPFYFFLKENVMVAYLFQGFRIAILVELSYALYKMFADILKQKEVLFFLLFPLLALFFYMFHTPIYVLLIFSAITAFLLAPWLPKWK